MVFFIPVFFYAYTAIAEENVFIDIGSFIAAVIVGQIASYKLYKYKMPKKTKVGAIIAIVLLAIVFIVFTFYPPHLPIFQDSQTGLYGIA